MSITGLDPQDHSYLHIQGRTMGMFPGDWKTVWVSPNSNEEKYATTTLEGYRSNKWRSPLFYDTKSALEFRLVRVTVRQTVTEEVLA